MGNPPNVPATPSETSPGASTPQPGQDPIISLMTTLGIRPTRENYVHMIDPGADPDDLDAEIEGALPEQFRVAPDDDTPDA